jgi:uncharacterized protein YceK
MKKLNVFMLLIIVTLLLSGCSRRITKRKNCRGKGHWYGNRNLSLNQNDTLRFVSVVNF